MTVCLVIGLFIPFLQFDVIKRYIDGGGSVLVMLGEGGESRFDTNINFFLEEFGININTGEQNVLRRKRFCCTFENF